MKSPRLLSDALVTVFIPPPEIIFYIPLRFRIAIALALAFLPLPLAQVYAADITVDSTCTLAQAINEANEATTGVGSCEAGDDANPSANPPTDGADTIILPAQVASTSSSPRVVTTLTAALPQITSNISIEGQGHVLFLHTGTSLSSAVGSHLTIRNLSIYGGSGTSAQLSLGDSATLLNVSLINANYTALRGTNADATYSLTNVYIAGVSSFWNLVAGLDAYAGQWIITDLLFRSIAGGHSVILVRDGASVSLQGCFSQVRTIPPAYMLRGVTDNSAGSCANHDRDNDDMIGNILDKNAPSDFHVVENNSAFVDAAEDCGLPAGQWFPKSSITYEYTLTADCQQDHPLYIPFGVKVIIRSGGGKTRRITSVTNNAIFVAGGELTLRNVNLVGKTASGTQTFLIHARPAAKLRIEDTTFQQADTAGSSAGIAIGGAEATLNRVTFDGLKSGLSWAGSAVYVVGGGKVQICDSIFRNNQGGAGAVNEYQGNSPFVILAGNTWENNNPRNIHDPHSVIDMPDNCPKPRAAPSEKKRDRRRRETIKPTAHTGEELLKLGYRLTATYGLQSGVQFQRRLPEKLGFPELIDVGVLDIIDVWGYVEQGVTVCFPQLGRTVFYDAANSPKTQAPLASYTRDGMTCVDIKRAGTIVLLPGDPSVTAPAMSLENCMVTTKYIMNFRDAPAGKHIIFTNPWGDRIAGWLPKNVTLTALERTADWFKVDYYGVQGWVSARHVSPQGACG